MKKWEYFILFGLGLGMALLIASVVKIPGYMDAEYYYAGGIEIAAGKGLNEPFLWNYLDDPAGLPHPAATYWMPLASLASALGITLTGDFDYFSARIVFILLASLVPVITAWLAFKLTNRRVTAWTAGGLAIFSGFYTVYLSLTETFALYMVLGTLFLVVLVSGRNRFFNAIILGFLAGLLHLARADGLLWLVIGGIYMAVDGRVRQFPEDLMKLAMRLGIVLAGYSLVMGFWFARNLQIFGGLFPPGANRALWLVNYDQLYNFPASTLSFQNWLAAGLPALLKMRWDALLENLQTLLAVQGGVFLLPLILAGIWRLRQNTLMKVGILAWLGTFLVMTIVFPLAGSRGGFLHSGAAFQPLFWAAGAEGVAGFVELGVRWRNWKFQRATIGFGILGVLVASLLTMGLTYSRIAPNDEAGSGWASGYDAYVEIGSALDHLSVSGEDVIMVNNPPGFFVATGRPAVVIPNGGVDTVLAAAEKYNASYLVLEKNSVKGLLPLYAQPVDLPGLKFIETVGQSHIFQIQVP